MKQSKIITAYNTAEQLVECNLTDQEQWEVCKLRQFLRPNYEFQQERENAIREKYSSFIDMNGMINGEKAQEFVKEINAIGDVEVELEERKKPQIKFTKGITFKITEPLEDFIEFLPPAE